MKYKHLKAEADNRICNSTPHIFYIYIFFFCSVFSVTAI